MTESAPPPPLHATPLLSCPIPSPQPYPGCFTAAPVVKYQFSCSLFFDLRRSKNGWWYSLSQFYNARWTIKRRCRSCYLGSKRDGGNLRKNLDQESGQAGGGGGRISDRYWAVLGRFTSGQRAMVMQWPAITGVNGYHYVEKVSVEYRTSEHQTVWENFVHGKGQSKGQSWNSQ